MNPRQKIRRKMPFENPITSSYLKRCLGPRAGTPKIFRLIKKLNIVKARVIEAEQAALMGTYLFPKKKATGLEGMLLIKVESDDEKALKLVRGERITLGNSATSNIMITNPGTSQDHADIIFREGEAFVRPRNPKAHISVNETPVKWKKKTRIVAGDVIETLGVKIRVVHVKPNEPGTPITNRDFAILVLRHARKPEVKTLLAISPSDERRLVMNRTGRPTVITPTLNENEKTSVGFDSGLLTLVNVDARTEVKINDFKCGQGSRRLNNGDIFQVGNHFATVMRVPVQIAPKQSTVLKLGEPPYGSASIFAEHSFCSIIDNSFWPRLMLMEIGISNMMRGRPSANMKAVMAHWGVKLGQELERLAGMKGKARKSEYERIMGAMEHMVELAVRSRSRTAFFMYAGKNKRMIEMALVSKRLMGQDLRFKKITPLSRDKRLLGEIVEQLESCRDLNMRIHSVIDALPDYIASEMERSSLRLLVSRNRHERKTALSELNRKLNPSGIAIWPVGEELAVGKVSDWCESDEGNILMVERIEGQPIMFKDNGRPFGIYSMEDRLLILPKKPSSDKRAGGFARELQHYIDHVTGLMDSVCAAQKNQEVIRSYFEATAMAAEMLQSDKPEKEMKKLRRMAEGTDAPALAAMKIIQRVERASKCDGNVRAELLSFIGSLYGGVFSTEVYPVLFGNFSTR